MATLSPTAAMASCQGCTELRVLDAPAAVTRSPSWQLLLDREEDVDCLGWAHLGRGCFALIIDDDDAPNGEVVMVDLADPELEQKVRGRSWGAGVNGPVQPEAPSRCTLLPPAGAVDAD